jgi:hypothetical protein
MGEWTSRLSQRTLGTRVILARSGSSARAGPSDDGPQINGEPGPVERRCGTPLDVRLRGGLEPGSRAPQILSPLPVHPSLFSRPFSDTPPATPLAPLDGPYIGHFRPSPPTTKGSDERSHLFTRKLFLRRERLGEAESSAKEGLELPPEQPSDDGP